VRRRIILAITLAFLGTLGWLTIKDLLHYGPTPLSVVSLVILIFLGIAIVGALIER
jgi:hypothetical protein